MLTKIMKWASIAGLFLAVLWRPSENFQLLLEFVVCAGAILVALDAVRAEEYVWATGFVAIALLFNPVAPVVLSREMFFWLGWVSVATFLASLVVLKSQPRLAMPSIVGQPRRDHELW
jgi:hypothetical protein